MGIWLGWDGIKSLKKIEYLLLYNFMSSESVQVKNLQRKENKTNPYIKANNVFVYY